MFHKSEKHLEKSLPRNHRSIVTRVLTFALLVGSSTLAIAQDPPPPQDVPVGQFPQDPSLQTPNQQGFMPVLPPSASGSNPAMPPPMQPSAIPPQPQAHQNSNQQAPPSQQPAATPAPQQTFSHIMRYQPELEALSTLVVKTSEGEFKIKLRPDLARENVENFRDLALGQKPFIDIRTGKSVRRPFYTGLNCHRVVQGFMIQCGCPFGDGRGGPGFQVNDEISPSTRFEKPGIVAMAPAVRRNNQTLDYEPHSNGSQFFISLAPLPEFNHRFTIIGEISSGMDTIRKIASTPTGPTDRPLKRVIILSVDPDLPPTAPVVPMEPKEESDPMAPAGTVDPFALPPPSNQ